MDVKRGIDLAGVRRWPGSALRATRPTTSERRQPSAMADAKPASRLDKLLALLHMGPSEAARAAAARQLGQIQREHPQQLHTLLKM